MRPRIKLAITLSIGIIVGVGLCRAHHLKLHKKLHHETYVSASIQRQFFAQYRPRIRHNTHSTKSHLPHIIHFIWVSSNLQAPEHLPKRVVENIQGWAKLNPNVRVMLWTNESIRTYFPKLVPTFKRIDAPALIADVMRYKILDQYGGLYLDTDIEALKPVAKLFDIHSGFTVCEDTGTPKPTQSSPSELFETHCVRACNAVIASPQHAPFIHESFKHAWRNVKSQPHIKKLKVAIAGPTLFSRYVFAHDIKILQQGTFYPCLWDNTGQCQHQRLKSLPKVYANHTWQGSWW